MLVVFKSISWHSVPQMKKCLLFFTVNVSLDASDFSLLCQYPTYDSCNTSQPPPIQQQLIIVFSTTAFCCTITFVRKISHRFTEAATAAGVLLFQKILYGSFQSRRSPKDCENYAQAICNIKGL